MAQPIKIADLLSTIKNGDLGQIRQMAYDIEQVGLEPIRVVADISGGAVLSVSADAQVDVLFISNDPLDVVNFVETGTPALVPLSEDMADPHAHWRWGTNGGSAKVEPDVCDHYFLQLDGI